MGWICRMDIKELATKEMSSTMAEIMKNSPVNERHRRMSWVASIMASTMPTTCPSAVFTGRPTANCRSRYSPPRVVFPSKPFSFSKIWVCSSSGRRMLLPARSESVVSSACPFPSQMRKFTSVIMLATPAMRLRLLSCPPSSLSSAVRYSSDICTMSCARTFISSRFSPTR